MATKSVKSVEVYTYKTTWTWNLTELNLGWDICIMVFVTFACTALLATIALRHYSPRSLFLPVNTYRYSSLHLTSLAWSRGPGTCSQRRPIPIDPTLICRYVPIVLLDRCGGYRTRLHWT